MNQRVEVFCNFFAGAILVPEDALVREAVVRSANKSTVWPDEELRRLADLYRVSREVILRRLLILHKTSEAFYRAKRDELLRLVPEERKRTSGFLSVPRKVLRDVGRPFARLVLDAYHREAITSSDVAEYLGARAKHFPEIEHLVYGPVGVAQGEE